MQPEQQHVSVPEALRAGMEHHQAGRLAEAERIYSQILEADPNNPDAFNQLGMIAHQVGRYELALQLFGNAIRVSPANPYFLNNLGEVNRQLRRPQQALANYDAALAIKPDLAAALSNRGNALQELRCFDEAIASYDRALAIKPDHAEALNNRGKALQELGRYDDAIASYDKALAVVPDYADALGNRGEALRQLRRYDEALASFDKSIALNAGNPETLNNRGNVLQIFRRYDEALASYDRCLTINRGNAAVFNNRGGALLRLKRYDEALVSLAIALSINPGFVEAINNRGEVLQEFGRYDEALACYDDALKIKPDCAECMNNRGNTLQRLKRYDEALACYNQALTIEPDFASAHWNRSVCWLSLGDFKHGWQEYEWRWRWDPYTTPRRNTPQPLWLGKENISGKSILLHAEQGFGDTIQFARYAQAVAARGATVILEVQPTLKSVISTISGNHEVVGAGEPSPKFDFHCPLLSLPLAFNTDLETIPSSIPYLHPSAAAIKKWKPKLGRKHSPRVGIVCSGRPTHTNDRNRSIALARLTSLANCGVQLVILQNELRPEDENVLMSTKELVYFGADLADFSDTAALVSLMDLIISVDTAVAHLAGAMGKPVWILLPYAADWRWLVDREDSPWYPTARLFRQPRVGDWDGVVDKVRQEVSQRFK